MDKLKVAFMATPDIAIDCAEYLLNSSQVSFECVVSMPDRPAGRGKQLTSPDLITWAKKNNIEFIQTANINKDNLVIETLESKELDLIIVFAFAQFLNDELLKLPKLGCFNIHTSLLPKYRGAAPIQYAILNNDSETGISIQKMIKKMDAGDIAQSLKVSIEPHETSGELYSKLKPLSAKALELFIQDCLNNSLKFTPQNESQVSFAPSLKKEQALLDFKNKTSSEIICQLRAFAPWPGSYCILNAKRLKVYAAETTQQVLAPGEVSTSLGQLVIGCKDSSLRLKQIQLAGKKASSDQEFLNGYRQEIKINP